MNTDPLEYEKNSGLQRSFAKEWLPRFLQTINCSNLKNENILDIGCGPGNNLNEVIKPTLGEVKSITGIDCCEQHIKHARQKYQSENVSFELFNLESDKVNDKMKGKFHHIFSFFTLHWVHNKINAVQCMYDFLAPNGDVSVLLTFGSILNSVHNDLVGEGGKWERFVSDEVRNKYRVFLDPEGIKGKEDVQTLFKNQGFKVAYCEVDRSKFNIGSIEAMKGLLRGADPFVSQIPEALQQEYIEDELNMFIKCKFITFEDNGCYLHLTNAVIHAVK